MVGSGSAEAVLSRVAVGRRGAAPDRDERRVVRSAQRGSEDAIESLIRTHWASSFRLALGVLGDRGLAEDCAQEGALAAVTSLDAFDSKRPFAPWLHRIVLNRALDTLRARRRNPEVAVAIESADSAPANSSDGELAAALTRLDERARAVVVLKHVLGYRAKEIAEIVGTSEGNVRSILSRAIAALRETLESEGAGDA